MFWSAVQRVSAISITFVSSIVLARMLSPDDFGYVGMLTVFIAVSATLVDGGLGSALIQKQAPTDTDYATVFYFNLTLAFLAYLVLFLCAPAIAAFYRLDQLTPMLRVMGIIVVINAFALVQVNQLVKRLQFGRLTTVDVVPSVTSTAAAIACAYAGLGVWSLIIRVVLNAVIRSTLVWLMSNWRPQRQFSTASFKELMGFGGLVFLSNATETALSQLVSLLIGRAYSARDLGYYTQASNLHHIPQTTIPYVVSQVLFPVFSSLQDNVSSVAGALRKSLKGLAFVNFPIMIALVIVAKPLIVILFTDKWIPSVLYFQVLCLGGMVYAANACNVTVLKAFGRGKALLSVTLIKRAATLIALLIGMQFGIFGIVWAWVAGVYLWVPVNAFWAGRVTGYGFVAQMKDVGPTYLIAVAAGIVVGLGSPMLRIENNYLLMAVQLTSYSCLYGVTVWFFRRDEFADYADLVVELARGAVRALRGVPREGVTG